MGATIPILNRTLYTDNRVFEALSALAEIRETTPDALATAMLGERLEQEHHLRWLIDRTKSDRKKRSEEYLQKLRE